MLDVTRVGQYLARLSAAERRELGIRRSGRVLSVFRRRFRVQFDNGRLN